MPSRWPTWSTKGCCRYCHMGPPSAQRGCCRDCHVGPPGAKRTVVDAIASAHLINKGLLPRLSHRPTECEEGCSRHRRVGRSGQQMAAAETAMQARLVQNGLPQVLSRWPTESANACSRNCPVGLLKGEMIRLRLSRWPFIFLFMPLGPPPEARSKIIKEVVAELNACTSPKAVGTRHVSLSTAFFFLVVMKIRAAPTWVKNAVILFTILHWQ
jgi:hypothetical protein